MTFTTTDRRVSFLSPVRADGQPARGVRDSAQALLEAVPAFRAADPVLRVGPAADAEDWDWAVTA